MKQNAPSEALKVHRIHTINQMDANNRLNGGIHIPRVDLDKQQQLQLNRRSQSTSNHSIQHSPNSNTNRRSTNSVSSISHATRQSIDVTIDTTDDSDSISKVINVCNEIDIETNCFATESLVRKCIRNQIWCNNKFVLDNTIKNMKIENKTNPKSVLNMLLKFTRKETLNNLNPLKFWKKYGPMVQQEINVLKTICSRAIKDEIMIGEFILYSFHNYYSILTQIDILFIGLKREYKSFQENQSLIDNSEQDQSRQNIHDIEDTVLRTLTIRKGKCPEEERGLYHKLLSLGWHTQKIETVLETDNEDLLYIFYVCCVSRSVRKQKWNESSQKKKISSFVDPSDEAFAMLVLENNVLKWMDKLGNGEVIDGSAIRMSLYTQSEQGRKWSTDGIM